MTTRDARGSQERAAARERSQLAIHFAAGIPLSRKMPFKVVQTLEGKKLKLLVVPSGWETDNILRYPPNKESKSYEDGEQVLDEMLLHSDTDDADNYRQKRCPQNQKLMTLDLNSKAENMIDQIVSTNNNDIVVTEIHADSVPDIVVNNAQDLDNLEKQLSDSGFRDRLKNICSMLCSGGKGIDCAYMLVDVLFTRKFICDCSWSGGSRGEELKVPLKGFKHVLSFFWSMVHQWDEKFTIKDNEMFFKTILKNAKKRKLAKCERASTSRRSTSKRNAKRIKVSENISDKDINEEENAEENEENDETIEENMEDHTEKSDTVEENMENNDKENNILQKNTVNNKEISDLAEESKAENKKNIQKEIKKNDKLKMVENKENHTMQSTSKRIANSDFIIGKETSV
ncbi:uncharacterized protein LOC124537743 [Vanessa cardui]|uniref:uncharacterized protein LOC124537743 n=1 Tax=Vanessa cardui TaxID=171605 RepID=UPI001F12DA52|nr:uncharacterized protein LOC124537743 [Vanessa cardui]